MQRDTTKRFYILHSWFGALTGILVFVICFTGAVSVFGRPELIIWANETIREPVDIQPQVIEDLVREYAEQVPDEYLDEIQILLPGVRSAANLYLIFEHEVENEQGKHVHTVVLFEFDPHSLELLSKKEGEEGEVFRSDPQDMASFLVKFHADLHLGNPIGLLLTGLIGLTLFASIVTGVITHRKILKESFKFRPYRSLRLLFTDSHKAFGVWGLVFHSMIAFTGAFLGLAVVILFPLAAYVSVQGDTEMLVERFLPEPEPQLTSNVTDLYIAEALQKIQEQEQGQVVTVALLGGKDEGAVAVVNLLAGEEIVSKTRVLETNSLKDLDEYTSFSRLGGAADPTLDAMFPLHFGNFAGAFVKFIWFILGLSTALMAVTGSMIWIERRTFGNAGSLSQKTYGRISRFTTGSCAGVVIAVGVLFCIQLFSVAMPSLLRQIGPVFFITWLLATVWAMLRPNSYVASKELLWAAGVVFVSIPLINPIMTGDFLVLSFFNGKIVTAMVDLVCLVSGLGLCFAGWKMPSSRPEKNPKEKNTEVAELEPVLEASV